MESQLSKGLVMDTEWKEDLEGWLEPFLIALGHKTRRRMCPAYMAQSAPSCDFGQVGERFGNVAFGIDDGNHRRGQFAPS